MLAKQEKAVRIDGAPVELRRRAWLGQFKGLLTACGRVSLTVPPVPKRRSTLRLGSASPTCRHSWGALHARGWGLGVFRPTSSQMLAGASRGPGREDGCQQRKMLCFLRKGPANTSRHLYPADLSRSVLS